MRRVVDGVGRALIALGALVLLFALYQLWGTNVLQARDQRALKQSFTEAVAVQPTGQPRSVTAEVEPDPSPTIDPPPVVERGDALGILEIDAIGLESAVVSGTGRDELRRGPGHYPHSPLPGRAGNASIAGHRTTYGAPFHDLDQLEIGDEIVVTTLEGTFTYIVSDSFITDPRDVSVVDFTDDNRLTLTTCHPKFSARERLIVVAHLDGEPLDAAPAPAQAAPPPILADENFTTDDAELAISHLDGAAASEARLTTGTFLWGGVLLLLGVAWWLASRRWRHWATWGIGALPFLAALFMWFGEIDRLLPANL